MKPYAGVRNGAVRFSCSIMIGVLVLSGMLPAAAQISDTPQIAFLNPSGFATRTGVGILISDRQPTRPLPGRATYRLAAWTSDAPVNAGVEFEILKSGVSLDTIDTTTTTSLDTYSAEWDIPDSLPDGVYTLRATLFADNEAVSNVDQEILLSRLAERAQITYPGLDPSQATPADGSFGTFSALAAELPEEDPATYRSPVGNIDGNHTGAAPGTGTSYVRAFYTVSSPGATPEWIACGTEAAPGQSTLSSAANNGVRCTLEKPEHQTAVTAVAAVANTSQGAFDAAMNGAGDATRVTEAYSQAPAEISLLPGSTGVVIEPDDDGNFVCHEATAFVQDPRGREIAGVNLDVHAAGPNDKLRFDRGLLSPAARVPDRQSHALEPGYDCFAGSDEVSDQAEHQILGGPDIKHIETAPAGSSDTGTWTFGLWTTKESVSPGRHSARFTVWVDETDDGCTANDDRLTHDELSVSGTVGFGGAPSAAEPFASSDLVACLPPIDEPAPREITLTPPGRVARAGDTKRVTGTITSAYPYCMSDQTVRLKRRKPGGSFRRVAEVTSDAGGYFEAAVPVRDGKNEYVAIATKNERCVRAKSAIEWIKGYS